MKNKNLQAAIIGCGNVAGGYDAGKTSREVWTHAKAYRKTAGVSLAAACDTHEFMRPGMLNQDLRDVVDAYEKVYEHVKDLKAYAHK